MAQIVKDEHNDYAILDLSDYIKLTKIANMKAREATVAITTNQLLFLNALMQELGTGTVTFIGDTVTIFVRNGDDEIKSSFDISLCDKYYNHVTKFISEVL